MALTFGAAVTDRINWVAVQSFGASQSQLLVMGWFLPTTLTAGNGLWCISTGPGGARVAGTTSEVEMRTDNTTDGVWTTTGAGLATGTWTFLAFAGSFNNTGPAAAWRVWAGTVDTPPVELTVTQNTAPVGNFTGSTNIGIGNTSVSGAAAWQGDIDEVVMALGATASGILSYLGTSTAGAITNTEADWILGRIVAPYWDRGVLPDLWRAEITGRGLSFETVGLGAFGTSQVRIHRPGRNTATTIDTAVSVTGVTLSQNASPRRRLPSLPLGYDL